MHSAAPYRPRVSPEHPLIQLKYTKLIQSASRLCMQNFPRWPGGPCAAAASKLYQSVILQPSVLYPPLPPDNQKQRGLPPEHHPCLPLTILHGENRGAANHILHHNNSGLNAIKRSKSKKGYGWCIIYICMLSRHG